MYTEIKVAAREQEAKLGAGVGTQPIREALIERARHALKRVGAAHAEAEVKGLEAELSVL